MGLLWPGAARANSSLVSRLWHKCFEQACSSASAPLVTFVSMRRCLYPKFDTSCRYAHEAKHHLARVSTHSLQLRVVDRRDNVVGGLGNESRDGHVKQLQDSGHASVQPCSLLRLLPADIYSLHQACDPPVEHTKTSPCSVRWDACESVSRSQTRISEILTRHKWSAGGSIKQHYLASYQQALLAVCMAQFSAKRYREGMQGVLALSRASRPLAALFQQELGLSFLDMAELAKYAPDASGRPVAACSCLLRTALAALFQQELGGCY